jgi:uncharacterized protein (TIGR02996 family)
MFSVVVRDASGRVRKNDARTEMLTIGRDAANDVVIAHPSVAPRHARIFDHGNGCWLVVDLGTRAGTFKNGQAVAGSTLFCATDVIRVGDFEIQVACKTPEDDDRETALLELIQKTPADPEPRLVYSDWLEERGDGLRAEYVRLQMRVGATAADPADVSAEARRFRELSQRVPLSWRAALARANLENCLSFEVVCPKTWDKLTPTEREDVRFCGACRSNVHFCATVADARVHAQRGACVALDLSVIRHPGDLNPRPMMVGMIMPPSEPPSPPAK